MGYVDPLDGTREFVEGRLENVACLIGIAKNNRSIAGVIGLPFPNGCCNSDDDNDDIIIHYAIADRKDCYGTWPTITTTNNDKIINDNNDDAITTTMYTGDSNNPILLNATKYAISLSNENNNNNTKHKIIGG